MAGHRYAAIVDDIRAAITSGRLRPGDVLPSTSEIRDAYGVANVTAQRVRRALIVGGLAEASQGVQLRVRDWSRAGRWTPDQREAPDDVVDGLDGQAADVGRDRVDPRAAGLLGVPAGTVTVRVVRTGTRAGRTVRRVTAWYPPDLVDLVEAGPVGAVWERLDQAGRGPVGAGVEEWAVRPAEHVDVDVFGLPEGARVLCGARALYDPARRPVEVALTVLPEHAWLLRVPFTVVR